MPFDLPLHFSWYALGPAARAPVAAVVAHVARIIVSGGLSLGGAGWTLSASAVRRRRELRITVVARQEEAPAAMAPGIDEFGYSAELTDVLPGRYRIIVTHRCHLAVGGYSMVGTNSLAAVVDVPAGPDEVADPAVRQRGQLRNARRAQALARRSTAQAAPSSDGASSSPRGDMPGEPAEA